MNAKVAQTYFERRIGPLIRHIAEKSDYTFNLEIYCMKDYTKIALEVISRIKPISSLRLFFPRNHSPLFSRNVESKEMRVEDEWP